MKYKIQVALDVVSVQQALTLAEETADYVDIIEAGTPLIKSAGMSVVAQLKKFGREVFADTKTMDAAEIEGDLARSYGADYFTVLAVAPRNTLNSARKVDGIKKVVDLIGVPDKVSVARELSPLFDVVVLHTGIDEGYFSPEGLEPLRDLPNIAVAGGIGPNNIDDVVSALDPEIVIIGRAITAQDDPRAAAKELREVLECL